MKQVRQREPVLAFLPEGLSVRPSVGPSVRHAFVKKIREINVFEQISARGHLLVILLAAFEHLYETVYPSVGNWCFSPSFVTLPRITTFSAKLKKVKNNLK